MAIRDQAVLEMNLAGFEPGDKERVLTIMDLFFDRWDSGGACAVMIPALGRLLAGKPLGPLTGADEEWYDHGDMGHPTYKSMKQNKRCSSVFENTYHDGRVLCRDIDNPNYGEKPRAEFFPYDPEITGRTFDPTIVIGDDEMV